jgi:hypothetical protein
MTTQLLTAALNDELRAAGPGLVGNDDLLRSVLSGCGDCIKVLDLDGRLQFMSEGGKRVMEVDDFSKLKGCPWPDFWGEEGSGLAAGAVAKAKAGATARFRGPANTARGTPRYWDVQVSPIFGADGAPSHLLSISRDITEEWTKTRELEEAAQRERFFTQELEHRRMPRRSRHSVRARWRWPPRMREPTTRTGPKPRFCRLSIARCRRISPATSRFTCPARTSA